jgi:hypothetical protein
MPISQFFLRREALRLAAIIAALMLASATKPAWAEPAAGASKSTLQLSSAMTAEEFSRSGLNKLTDSERAALEAWLSRHIASEKANQLTAISKEPQGQQGPIEARISGSFSGWSGDTTFVLDNGQVWRQRIPGKFRYDGPDNPPVTISRNILGFYVLTLSDIKRGIGVERVK